MYNEIQNLIMSFYDIKNTQIFMNIYHQNILIFLHWNSLSINE